MMSFTFYRNESQDKNQKNDITLVKTEEIILKKISWASDLLIKSDSLSDCNSIAQLINTLLKSLELVKAQRK